MTLDQPLGGGNEVVEYILLVQAGSRFVPGSAILSTTAQVGLRVDTTKRSARLR